MPQLPIVSIIDDDGSVRVAIERIVRSLDLVARTFRSCHEFLSSPRFRESSCIIADVQMPGMTGVELLTTLKAMGLAIPFIFITAYPNERLRKEASDAGAICFLNKPFDGASIIACIEQALDRRH